jgi:type VI secretion system protein ImpH
VEPGDRTASEDLTARLSRDARRYSFFQVVRLMQSGRAGVAKVGHGGPASEELLRFRPLLSFEFPASDVASAEVVKDSEGQRRLLVETTFMGLYGSSSPLPSYFTEDLLHEVEEDSLVRGFLDLFHHRLISFIYRCWAKYRYFVQFERDADDEFSHRVLGVMGLGLPGAAERAGIPPARVLRYAGLLSRTPCSLATLRCLLSDYFEEVAVDVEPFVPRWVVIPTHSRCRLGVQACRLGVDSQLGERVLDYSGKFRVTVGPMSCERYFDFLPGGEKLSELKSLVRLACSDLLEFDVELKLEDAEVPEPRLYGQSPSLRLGHTAWLGPPEKGARVVLEETGLNPASAAS